MKLEPKKIVGLLLRVQVDGLHLLGPKKESFYIIVKIISTENTKPTPRKRSHNYNLINSTNFTTKHQILQKLGRNLCIG